MSLNPWSSCAKDQIVPQDVIGRALSHCEGGWYEHTAKDDPEDVALAQWYLGGSHLLQTQLRVVCQK